MGQSTHHQPQSHLNWLLFGGGPKPVSNNARVVASSNTGRPEQRNDMPPKRTSRATRTAQLQPQPTPTSDYETDTVNPSDAAPTLAPPPQRTNTELNLTVLRRYEPSITHILSIAPFAVVYTFSPDSQQWEKCGIEGTLFVCQLSSAKSGRVGYNVMILNRKSLDNFTCELVSAEDVEVTEQYVILQAMGEDGVTPAIYGIWIFSDAKAEGQGPSTREIVAGTIQSCAMQAQIASEAVGAETGLETEVEMETEEEGANGHGEEHGHTEDVEAEEEDHGYGYGMDGTTQHTEQMEEEEAVAQQAGQRLDLLQLFSSKPAQAQAQAHAPSNPTAPFASAPRAAAPPPAFDQQQQPTRFTPTADTDFFRSSRSPAGVQQQQQRAPPPRTQQNALLDLFKK